jgi:membrane-associated phospholipid phosphatase
MFAIFAFKLFGKKWGALSLVYPFCIIVGVVYMGEHYIFDVITGAILAVSVYYAVPYLMTRLHPSVLFVRKKALALQPRIRALQPAFVAANTRRTKK